MEDVEVRINVRRVSRAGRYNFVSGSCTRNAQLVKWTDARLALDLRVVVQRASRARF